MGTRGWKRRRLCRRQRPLGLGQQFPTRFLRKAFEKPQFLFIPSASGPPHISRTHKMTFRKGQGGDFSRSSLRWRFEAYQTSPALHSIGTVTSSANLGIRRVWERKITRRAEEAGEKGLSYNPRAAPARPQQRNRDVELERCRQHREREKETQSN